MNCSILGGRPMCVAAQYAVVLGLAVGLANGQPPAYNVINLGTLGGNFMSAAYGINNSGRVVGSAFTTGDAANHATLFSGTGTGNLDLGTLGTSTDHSHAYGINDSNQVVGDSSVSGTFRAALFSGTGSGNLNLGILAANPFGNSLSRAYAINNSAQIVGVGSNAAGWENAVLFSGTGSGNLNLGTLGGVTSQAYGINDSGQIVGPALHASGTNHAALFSGTGTGNFDLGTLGGPSSQAIDINESGQIVGHAGTTGNGPTHAALYSGTGSGNSDLGTLGGTTSRSYAINNAGQVVGNAAVLPSNVEVGFLYSGGTMFQLNSLIPFNSPVAGITIGDVGHSINDWGQIAGNGVSANGPRAVRLDPVNPFTSTIGGGASRNTKFIGGMGYGQFTITTDPGNLGTTVSLLGGTVGSGGPGTFGLNRDVNMAFSPHDPMTTGSDIVSLTGTESDTFVLQLSYDESLFGNELDARLGWYDAGQWNLAVDGNTGGTSTFFAGPWNSSYSLGFYGVDISANTVWAVLNHNSDFAAVPDPRVPGDATGDGCVSGADFTVWADHFGAGPGAVVADGDFTGDGFVTGGDFTVWADHFGEGCAPGNAVPEPHSAWLALIALVSITAHIRRQRHARQGNLTELEA